jgi:hypothetical protein
MAAIKIHPQTGISSYLLAPSNGIAPAVST